MSSSRKAPRALLNKHGLAPSKKRGQNFLVNPDTARRIVAVGNYSRSERVVEVGVGLGALTTELAKQVEQVIGVEIDRGLIRYHEEEQDLPANVLLLHADILKISFEELSQHAGHPFKIIANLPYSISNPFLFKLIENRNLLSQVIVMLQKEVSDRLTAPVGSKTYGIPSVLLNSFASIQKHLLVKPAEFHPRPKIDSEVIEIVFTKRVISFSSDNLRFIVRTAFNNRRKTILNNLNNPSLFHRFPELEKTQIKAFARSILSESDIDPSLRAESLTSRQFEALTIAYENLLSDYTAVTNAD